MERIFKLISIGLVLLELFSSVSSLPYSKYGRSCSDIGCLSSEVCVMAVDSCSYGQRENKECGRYPTCRKSGSVGGSTGPGGYLNPLPENTRVSQSQDPSREINTNFNGNPNVHYQPPPFGGSNAFPPQQPFPPSAGHYPNQYPQNPQYPQYPQNPQYPQPGYAPGNQPYPGQQPPGYYNPQHTTEPSLWHQFLYNKSGAHSQMASGNPIMTLTLLLAVILTSAWRYIH